MWVFRTGSLKSPISFCLRQERSRWPRFCCSLAELHQRSYPEAKLSHLGTGPLQNRTVHRSGWETDYAEISPRPLPVEPLDHFCRNGQWTTSGRTNHYRKEQRIDDGGGGGAGASAPRPEAARTVSPIVGRGTVPSVRRPAQISGKTNTITFASEHRR